MESLRRKGGSQGIFFLFGTDGDDQGGDDGERRGMHAGHGLEERSLLSPKSSVSGNIEGGEGTKKGEEEKKKHCGGKKPSQPEVNLLTSLEMITQRSHSDARRKFRKRGKWGHKRRKGLGKEWKGLRSGESYRGFCRGYQTGERGGGEEESKAEFDSSGE